MNQLTGCRILNTRPKGQAASLTAALETQNATVIELPLLEITPTSRWRTRLPDLTQFKYAIFTSPNAVTYFFEHMPPHTCPSTLSLLTIGQGTAHALSKYGLTSKLSPEEANSESMLNLPALHHIEHTKILLIKGVGGRQLLEKTLRARGAELEVCAVYRRRCPATTSQTLQNLWQMDAIDMIIITSATMLRYLFQCAEEETIRNWLRNKPFFVISERIARAFKHEKIKTMIVTSYDNLLNTLKDFSHEQSNG